MNRVSVQSTNLASIGYDSASLTLEVEFTNGSIYQYFEVPTTVHAELMAAPSHGKFLNAEVKGKFRHAKM